MSSLAQAVSGKLTTYIGTMRVVVNCPDEVGAKMAMGELQKACEELLDEEDGDEVVVTQVTSITTDVEPEELLVILRKARNALIRTRITSCHDHAMQLDQEIHYLKHRGEPGFSPPYDYGRSMDLTERILTKGEEPRD